MSQFFYAIILISTFNSVNAKIYSENEIQNFYVSYGLEQKHQQVIVDYKDSINSDDFLKLVINAPDDDLLSEYHLNGLLDYLSNQRKNNKHLATVMSLQKHQSQALKKHEEGSFNVPIFNIQARAKGVENIWHMQEVQETIIMQLELDIQSGLIMVKQVLAEKHEAKTLGIKNSLKYLSEQAIHKLSKFFNAHINQIKGLEKYIIDFAVETDDKLLINKLNSSLPKVYSEYLLRNIIKHYEEDYSIQQLIKHSQSGSSKRFSVSLLKPYVDGNKGVQDYLISVLDNKELSSVSAFSLSQSQEQTVIDLLENKFLLSDSEWVKNNIRLSLKLSSHSSAQKLLEQLNKGDDK